MDGLWVLGCVQRDTGAFRLEVCPGNRRNKETLEGLVQKYVEPGTTIYTDLWRGYNGLSTLGYSHGTVNHSTNFVDPVTGVHTQQIESHWRALKRRMSRGGIKQKNFPEHFAEFVYFKRKADVFMSLVSEMTKKYNNN